MGRRRLRVAAALLFALIVLALLGVQLAARQLQSRLQSALGPRATIGAVHIGLTGLELRDLRIAAVAAPAQAWPADDELRAARVMVRPDLRSLWSVVGGGPWRIASVRVEDGYLSMLRGKDGRLRLLPALLETHPPASSPAGEAAPAAAPALVIGQVQLERTAIDLYDASLRGVAMHQLPLREISAQAGPIVLPALDQSIALELKAVLKGPSRDGRITISGQLTPATRDADLSARVQGVDLVALQPYLFKPDQGGIRHGTLDLAVDARVQSQHLHAPGSVTLAELELDNGNGLGAALGGLSRQAVLAAMKRDGRITVKFTLEGRLDDPSFSLNENFATRLSSGLAETLGVSVKGAVQGVGQVLKGLLGH